MFGFLCESFGFKMEIHVERTERFQDRITLPTTLMSYVLLVSATHACGKSGIRACSTATFMSQNSCRWFTFIVFKVCLFFYVPRSNQRPLSYIPPYQISLVSNIIFLTFKSKKNNLYRIVFNLWMIYAFEKFPSHFKVLNQYLLIKNRLMWVIMKLLFYPLEKVLSTYD